MKNLKAINTTCMQEKIKNLLKKRGDLNTEQVARQKLVRKDERDQDALTLLKAKWEKAHLLTLAIYKTTANFPKDELYGLTSQVRRASTSIPANIAEGCGRGSENEMARYLQISMGSASELEYHLLLAHDLGYISTDQYSGLSSELIEVKRMLTGLIKKLRADS